MADLKKERERRRREANTETIFHAAESVIIRKGVAAATMDEIAREAQFSKATLYQYFRSKAELVDEIVLHYYDDIRKLMEGIVAEDLPGAEKLRRLVRASIEFHDEKENISRVLMTDEGFRKRLQAFLAHGQGDLSPAEKRFTESMMAKLRAVLGLGESVLAEGIRRREFRPMDVETGAAFLSAAVMGLFHDFASRLRRLGPKERTDVVVEFLLNGIAAPPGPRKGVSK